MHIEKPRKFAKLYFLLIVDFRTPKQAIVDQRVGVVDLSPTMLQAAKLDSKTLKELQGLGYTQ